MVHLAKKRSQLRGGKRGAEEEHKAQGTSCHSSQDQYGAKGNLGRLWLGAACKIFECLWVTDEETKIYRGRNCESHKDVYKILKETHQYLTTLLMKKEHIHIYKETL